MQEPRRSATTLRCRPLRRVVHCAATPRNIPPLSDQGPQPVPSTKPAVRTVVMLHSPALSGALHALSPTLWSQKSEVICCLIIQSEISLGSNAELCFPLYQVVEPKVSVAAQLNNAWKHQWEHLMEEVMPDERVSPSAQHASAAFVGSCEASPSFWCSMSVHSACSAMGGSWSGSHGGKGPLVLPHVTYPKLLDCACAGRCKGLGTDVHICGRIRLHGDADVPCVRLLVLCGWPPPNHADISLGASMQKHSFCKLLCREQRVTLVLKLSCARHVPSVRSGSVKPIKASSSAAVPASMEGYQTSQRCTCGAQSYVVVNCLPHRGHEGLSCCM